MQSETEFEVNTEKFDEENDQDATERSQDEMNKEAADQEEGEELHDNSSVHLQEMGKNEQQLRELMELTEQKNHLEEMLKQAQERKALFMKDFKRHVARDSEYMRSGKKIPLKIIQEVEDFEFDKNAELEEARATHITLKNRLVKLEAELRGRDQLAEGLHIIDFEQLKIENQTLSEKIGERQEQVQELKKKIITTIQVLAHMREKMGFLEKRGGSIHSSLTELDKVPGWSP
ncbi:hypothetical protein Pmar_PMAR012906 [Perkinsus marinus ATCC 50983]|uniref:CCDC113/CCDC96 coiled-coil domain-containing protein n=1 Tax=Perkinsus marinus (strain ATCC 50983 / TXsc) TaxID=423536 RepID=C5LWI0_PERM5|nr:hypothetical protein Pmar_PMAR012906 [Perkinsus marinus ATCC 50983]EEQ98893.1 hypothetical protein Pmar_PMAR012906 [Perkinsus marinus ATCC 50983]|eukprot:XP_002766176.1 hypothetical protein Pmar_PMAR012906 [Perkinsus marinus ATCC 50983]